MIYLYENDKLKITHPYKNIKQFEIFKLDF